MATENSKNLKILVSDDSDASRHLLSKILIQSGYTVISAEDGHDALNKFISEKPDLLITDIKMPKMNGFELASEIKSRPEFAHIPIIFISAMFKDISSKIKGMDVGGNEYLTHPVDRDELIHKVKVVLNSKKLYDELLASREALHASEQKYRALFENANDSIYLICPETQKILDCNAKATEMTGYTKGQLMTMSISDLHPNAEQDVVSKIFQKVIKMGSLSSISGIHHLNKNEEHIPIEINATILEISSKKFCLGIFRDITDRKRGEENKHVTQEEWEKTFDTIPDLIAVIDTEHRIVKANRAMINKLGVKRGDLVGQLCYKMMHGSDHPPSFCPHSKTIANGREHIKEIYEENLQGYYLVSSSPMYDSKGNPIGVVEVARDITARKKLEKKLEESAVTDHLTGLFNRRGFMTIAEKQLKLSKRTKRQLSLVYLDLDNLKLINDKCGHEAGDQALRDTAGILKRTFRESDIIARIGGDEFSILLIEPLQLQIAETVINHLNKNIRIHNQRMKREYEISLSMGIAHHAHDSDNAQTLDDLLRSADNSMYREKEHRKFSKTPSKSEERRSHPRISGRGMCMAEISRAGKADVVNVSLGGICLTSSKRLSTDSVHGIKIQNVSGKSAESEAVVLRSTLIRDKENYNKNRRDYATRMKFIDSERKTLQTLSELITDLQK